MKKLINKNEPQRYYITKYALTMGILVRELIEAPSDGYAGYYPSDSRMWTSYKIDSDCFLDENQAKEKAELMRKKAIDAANKKLKKLKEMTNHLELDKE